MLKRLICVLLLSTPSFAGTYWVSPTGAAAWGTCTGSTALSGAAACSLGTANTNAAAGDTVYLRAGSYNTTLAPTHSGTCAGTCLGGTGATRITFAAYTGETPIITGVINGITLSGVNWTKITGITFQNYAAFGFELLGGASYNEISYNQFVNIAPNFATSPSIVGAGVSGPPWSVHNWVHHNYISRSGNPNPCGEAVDLIRIGMAENDLGTCATSNPANFSADNYNTVENNYLEYGAHCTLTTFSKYNVIKGNIAHNEPWISGCVGSVNVATYDNPAYNGLYGHRNFDIGDADVCRNNYNLVEGNRLGFASTNPGNGGSSGIDQESPGNILRYNFIYGGMNSGIYFKFTNSYGNLTGGVLNHVYNNTIYANGKGWNAGLYGTGNFAYNGEGIAQFSGNGQPTNNVVKNNLVYGNGYSGQWDICNLGWYAGTNCSASALDTVANNWLTSNGDPKFTNPALTDPTSQNLTSGAHGYTVTPIPDLSLQASSPAIDGGTFLTTATNSGTSATALTVADASYFQDGTSGSDLARGVTLFPDWIAIGTVGNTVQISSINYGTNTITLASPMTWSNADHVWLYKKSDGVVVLVGSAPDYGASEFVPSFTTPNIQQSIQCLPTVTALKTAAKGSVKACPKVI